MTGRLWAAVSRPATAWARLGALGRECVDGIGGRRRSVPALLLGLCVVAVLAYVDFRVSRDDIVISTVVLGPLVCSRWGRARDVMIVGAVATALALVSTAWNDNFAEATYFLRAAVVAMGSTVAALAAGRRETVVRDRARFELLSAAAEFGAGALTLEDTAACVSELIVPAAADVCVIDVVAGPEEQRRLAVRVDAVDRGRVEAALMTRPPTGVDVPGRSEPFEPASARLMLVDDVVLRGAARDDADLEFLRSLRAASAIAVPLVARGRPLGTLTMATTARSGRLYVPHDLEFAQVLADRVALALDNAGLFAELGTMEAQLSAAMSGLAEAVVIHNASGALVYVNEAAVRLLGVSDRRELAAASMDDVVRRIAPTDEDGRPIPPGDLPGRRVLAGRPAEPIVTHGIDPVSGQERWLLTKATPVRDRNGDITLVVNVIEDITEVKRSERHQRLLARAGHVLSASLDYEQTLQRVAELAVPTVADWCSVNVPDRHGRNRTVAVSHRDPARTAVVRDITTRYPGLLSAPSEPASASRARASLLANDLTPLALEDATHDPEHARLLAQVGVRAALVVPIVHGGRELGTLNLARAESARSFCGADIALAEELARLAGTAVENARLYTERTRIARLLQSGLLPEALPAMPGWEACCLYGPAEVEEHWVGGDFFDSIAVPSGWLAVVGDVAGHGAEAAALTALARHTLRSTARLLDDPLDAIDHLDDELLQRDSLSLCTVAAALLGNLDGRGFADIVCAGHPQPLLIVDGQVHPVGAHGPMLGAFADGPRRWRRTRVETPPGSILVLYTDGVLDTVGPDEERFGAQRLADCLAGATTADDAVARIDAALKGFEVGTQADDTAVLAIQRTSATEDPTGAVPHRAAE